MRRLLLACVLTFALSACAKTTECDTTLTGVSCTESSTLSNWWSDLDGSLKAGIGLGAAWLVGSAFVRWDDARKRKTPDA